MSALIPCILTFTAPKSSRMTRVRPHLNLNAQIKSPLASLPISERQAFGLINFKQHLEQSLGVILYGSIGRKLTVLAHPLAIIVLFLITKSIVRKTSRQRLFQFLRNIMQKVQSSTQLDKKKANLRAQANYDRDIETEDKKNRLNDGTPEEDENRKKQAARKNAADTLAKKDIKLRLNTIKDMKLRSQQDDNYRIASSTSEKVLKDVEVLESGNYLEPAKVETKGAGQTSKLILIAKKHEDMTNLALQRKRDDDDRSRQEAEAKQSAITKKLIEEKEKLVVQELMATIAKNEVTERARQVLIRKQKEDDIKFKEESRLLVMDKADTVERNRQSVIAVQREEDARLVYVAKREAAENDRVSKLSIVKLAAVATKEAEERARQAAIRKQQEEDEMKAEALARKIAEEQAILKELEEEARLVAVAKEEALEKARQAAAIKQEEEDSRMAVIAKMEADEKAKAQAEAARQLVLMLREEQVSLAAGIKKVVYEKLRKIDFTTFDSVVELSASIDIELKKQELEDFSVGTVAIKVVDGKLNQLAVAKEEEEEQMKAISDGKKLPYLREKISKVALPQQLEEEAVLSAIAKKEAAERGKLRQRAFVKQLEKEARIATVEKSWADKKNIISNKQFDISSKVISTVMKDDNSVDDPRITTYAKTKAVEKITATLSEKEEMTRLSALPMAEVPKKSTKVSIARQQPLKNEVNTVKSSMEKKGVSTARMTEAEDRLLTAIKLTLKAGEDENEIRTAASVLASWWTPKDAMKKRNDKLDSLRMSQK